MKKLNIGCGYRTMFGYVNADINRNLPNIDLFCSLNSIPVEPDTFDEVFASHCIEHVPFEIAKDALREWLRILKKGGVAIIDTPNIERNIKNYLEETWMLDFEKLTPSEKEYCSLNGVPNKTLHLNFKIFSSDRLYDLHFNNFDAELLVEFCRMAGFSKTEVTQTEPSLIVRATK